MLCEVKINARRNKILLLCILFLSRLLFSQTTLAPGDIAIVGFKTNATTQSGNDAVKLITLLDLSCGTEFIVTNNNWNGSSWACDDDEFGIQITCNTNIAAGSIFYLDVETSTGIASCSGGTITQTNLGSPWGTNFGLNSQGDNLYVLQGTRTSPNFIFAFKHVGAFTTASCSSRDNAALPSALSLGSTAIQMPSIANQWNYNFVVNSGSKATLLSAISNTSNWLSNTSHVWDSSNGIVNVSGTFLSSGVLAVSGAGCGCLAGCQLAYSGSTNCGAGVAGNCTAGYQNMSQSISVPANCTYIVTAVMCNRSYSCSSSGADGDCQTCDVLKVDISGGVKIFQQGATNSTLTDSYTATGPATIIVSGRANRADEIITYNVSATPCNCFNTIILSAEMEEFSVKMDAGAVKLYWSFLSQETSTTFYLEKSKDAFLWETFNVLVDSEPADQKMNFSIYDSSPFPGISYYRIRYKTESREEKYSQIKEVDYEKKAKKLIRTINYLGQDSGDSASGIRIEIYQDGSVRKVVSIPD